VNLEKVALVHQLVDDVTHVVRREGIARDHSIERLADAVSRVARLLDHGSFLVALRKKACRQQVSGCQAGV
jgi:hypothetical protein